MSAERGNPVTRIPLGGSGQLVPTVVVVKNDGGSPGGPSTHCSFTYSIYSVTAPTLSNANRLAAALTPQAARTSVGAYVAAAEGSYGLAMRVGTTWHLLVAYDEVPSSGVCSGS